MSGLLFLVIILFSLSATAPVFAQSPAKPAGPTGTPASSPASTPLTPPPTVSVAPAPAPTKSVVDSTDPRDLKEAIQLLKGNYVRPDLLDETELNRATFEGILSRLGHGVILLPGPAKESAESASPFFSEVLDGHIGYVRFGDLTRKNLEALDTDLKSFDSKKVDAIIMDLRSSGVTNDFATAAEFIKRFCPKGSPLFSLRKAAGKQEPAFTSDRDPSYQGLMILLVDGDTAGAAEAMAGVIRLYNKALVVGQPTAGRAVEYSDLKLPSGKILRVAVSEVILPEAHPLFPEGIKPDVSVEMSAADKRTVVQQSREKGMTPFVVETERPHLNEAALLSGKNPELEAMEAAQKHGSNPDKTSSVKDPVVERALDLVTSIGVFQKR